MIPPLTQISSEIFLNFKNQNFRNFQTRDTVYIRCSGSGLNSKRGFFHGLSQKKDMGSKKQCSEPKFEVVRVQNILQRTPKRNSQPGSRIKAFVLKTKRIFFLDQIASSNQFAKMAIPFFKPSQSFDWSNPQAWIHLTIFPILCSPSLISFLFVSYCDFGNPPTEKVAAEIQGRWIWDKIGQNTRQFCSKFLRITDLLAVARSYNLNNRVSTRVREVQRIIRKQNLQLHLKWEREPFTYELRLAFESMRLKLELQLEINEGRSLWLQRDLLIGGRCLAQKSAVVRGLNIIKKNNRGFPMVLLGAAGLISKFKQGKFLYDEYIYISVMNIKQPPQQQFETEVPQSPTEPAGKAAQAVEESKNASQERRQGCSEECMKEARRESHDQNRMEIQERDEAEPQGQEDDNNSELGNGLKKIEDQGTAEAKDKRKRVKKIKNLKCSACLKKRSGKGVISCKSCPKIFHLECLNIDPQKIPRKYQCDKCRVSLKEREHKKKIKAAKLHEKIAIKMNSESKKSQKQLAELMRKLPPVSETDQGKERLMTEFQYKYKYYVHKNKIVFPIEDDLFDQYPSILPKNAVLDKPQPTSKLSKHFGVLLELWNCLQTFPEYFEEQHKLSVADLQTVLQYPKNFIFTENMYLHLLKFYLQDIFNDKFEMNRHFTTNSFLALLRYCHQNNSFDRIFRFVWVQFLEQISHLPDYEQIFKRNPNLIDIVSRLRNKQNEPWMPSNADSRYYILKSLLSGVVDTASFHESLYEKIDQGRQTTRQKNQYQQNLKTEDGNLQTIKESIKNLEKQLKEKQKALDSAGERANKPKLEKEVERVTQALDKLIEERDQASKNIEIYKQSIEYASNSTTHTSIWLLGQDKQRRSYWFMLDQRDKLFVNTPQQVWYYYDYYKINNQLTKCLNLKGTREKNLYDTLISYRKSNYFTTSQNKHNSSLDNVFKIQQEHQQQVKQYADSGVFDFDKEKFISFKFIKNMLIEGERKIYAYLEERNARWSTQEDRELYLESIRSATKNQQIMEAVKYLNEKICVVEIEYKFVVEDDNQEVATYDSKTRKIQTKMWGINEKYKHAWLDYGRTAKNLLELFFLVAILYLTIERYVKKMRETRKIKREIEEVKVQKHNKLLNKTDSDGKEVDASQWDELCNICKKWGDLICCDMCPKVFHLECIGMKEVPEGQFKCKQCGDKRQTRSKTKKITKVG